MEETVTQVFGSRQLPPPSLLPGKVSDAVEAWRGAAKDAAEAKAALGHHRRAALPAARREDIEQYAAALESGKPPPKRGTHEERADQKLRELERQAAAAELVESRARARMDERISEHAGAIAHAAEKRAAEAKRDFLAAIDALEAASERLREATAFQIWAKDTGAPWKLRALRGVPIPRHSSDAPDLGSVVSALREVVEPPRRPSIPSPFTVAAPVEEPKGEPAPASAP
jgi:hypothetical protein